MMVEVAGFYASKTIGERPQLAESSRAPELS